MKVTCTSWISKSAICTSLQGDFIAGMLYVLGMQIVKDKRTKKTKGFGFVSFLDSLDMAKALKEMNGKYIGNRPCKLRKSTWDERNVHFANNKKPPQPAKNNKK